MMLGFKLLKARSRRRRADGHRGKAGIFASAKLWVLKALGND
jgi:hypothetical protein